MKYIVKSPILRDGKLYRVGDEIELSEEEAKNLIPLLIEKIEEIKEVIQESEEAKKGGKKK